MARTGTELLPLSLAATVEYLLRCHAARSRHWSWITNSIEDEVKLSEDNSGPGDHGEYKEQQEAVAHTEDGKGEVFLIFYPVVTAADTAKGDGEDGHEETEHTGCCQLGAVNQAP